MKSLTFLFYFYIYIYIYFLFIYQKKLLRNTLRLKVTQSCSGFFEKFNALMVIGIYILEILFFFFKNKHIVHDFVVDSHTSMYDYGTRHKNRYCVPNHRLTLTISESPTYAALKFCNVLPNSIKEISNLHLFRDAYKRIVFLLVYK